MAIISILDKQLDSRKNGDDCAFNGYLEDYLNLGDEIGSPLKEAFEQILEKDPEVKICVGLKSEINRDAISNQIIRYKDVFKLMGKAMVYPYILYASKEGNDRALLVVPFSKYSFIYAKGYYYCMTEPGSQFIDCKNEIVAISSDKAEKITGAYAKLFEMKAGALQRSIDRESFHSYDELKADAIAAADQLKADAPAELEKLEDRTKEIYQLVIDWFLLKKVLYVQYMVNKDMLNTVHEGNVKKQRNQAKINADEINFMSFSELWRCGTQNEHPQPAAEKPAEEKPAEEKPAEEAAPKAEEPAEPKAE